MLKFEDLRIRVLSEKFYTYKMPEDKSLTMYDFYVLDYLKSILDWPSKNFRDLPTDLVDSVNNAVQNLYPALRQELLDAVFYAVCAEIRYAENLSRREYNRKIAFENTKYKKLYTLWVKYQHFHKKSLDARNELVDIYDIRKPSAKNRVPTSEKDNREERNLSYKGAQYAIEKSGYSYADFMEMCEELYNTGSWDSSYGGTAWGNICRGWLDLNAASKIDPNVREVKEVDYGAGLKDEEGKEIKSTKKTDSKPTKAAKKPMSVAIDHIYDLQHNTDTVFNKLKSYYKGGYWWIKTALDDKANVKSYHNLLNKASGTVKAMALPILYNKLGQTWEKEMNIQKPVDAHPQVTSIEDAFTPVSSGDGDFKVGDFFQKTGNTKSYIKVTSIVGEDIIYDLYKDGKVSSYDLNITKEEFNYVLMNGSWVQIKTPDPIKPEKNTNTGSLWNNKSNYIYKKGDKVKFINIGDGTYTDFEDGQIYKVAKDSTDTKYVVLKNSLGQDRSMYATRVELVESADSNIELTPPEEENNTSLKVGDIFMDAERKPGVNKASFLITKVTPTTYTYDIFEKGIKVIVGHEVSKPSIDMSIKNGVYVVSKDPADKKKVTRPSQQQFNVGDKIKCVDDNNLPHDYFLTMGRVYTVTGFSKTTVAMLDDNGYERWFKKSRFEPVTESEQTKDKTKFDIGDFVIVKIVSGGSSRLGKIIDNSDQGATLPSYKVEFSDGSSGWYMEKYLSRSKNPEKKRPKFKVGDWIIVKGMIEDYPGQIIKYDKTYADQNMNPYLVKYQDLSLKEEWVSEDNILPDNQI